MLCGGAVSGHRRRGCPMSKRYIVTLTAEERGRLEELTRSGRAAARKMIHARILLKADVAEGGPGWPDERIADALGVSASTVRRIRLLFVEEGLAAALDPRPARRVPAPKLDGAKEAHLIALACGEAPEGRARWTLRLLAERFVALGHAETPSHETVRRTLKNTQRVPDCGPG
jgi:transposase